MKEHFPGTGTARTDLVLFVSYESFNTSVRIALLALGISEWGPQCLPTLAFHLFVVLPAGKVVQLRRKDGTYSFFFSPVGFGLCFPCPCHESHVSPGILLQVHLIFH